MLSSVMSRGNIILITKHKMMFGWPLRGLPKMNMFNKSLDFVKHMFRRFPVSVPPPLPFVFLSIERGGGYVRRLGGGERRVGSPFSLGQLHPSHPHEPGFHLIPLKNCHLVESMQLLFFMVRNLHSAYETEFINHPK